MKGPIHKWYLVSMRRCLAPWCIIWRWADPWLGHRLSRTHTGNSDASKTSIHYRQYLEISSKSSESESDSGMLEVTLSNKLHPVIIQAGSVLSPTINKIFIRLNHSHSLSAHDSSLFLLWTSRKLCIWEILFNGWNRKGKTDNWLRICPFKHFNYYFHMSSISPNLITSYFIYPCCLLNWCV